MMRRKGNETRGNVIKRRKMRRILRMVTAMSRPMSRTEGRRKKEEGRRKNPPNPPCRGGRTSGPKDRDKWTKKQLSAEQVDAYPNFQRWWKAYPVKKGKRLAFEAWVKRGLEFEDIDVLVKKLAQHHKGVEPEFVPHGSTYLNQYRDEDDLQPDSKPKRSGGRYQIDGELGA